MNWTALTSTEQLTELIEKSKEQPQVIFKHSTRCNISNVVLKRLESNEAPVDATFYYLDLLTYRSLSNLVAEKFKVYHESPQILIIKNGECSYEESHMAIQMDDIKEQVA